MMWTFNFFLFHWTKYYIYRIKKKTYYVLAFNLICSLYNPYLYNVYYVVGCRRIFLNKFPAAAES